MTGPLFVTVWVDGWQHDCCGPDLVVGDAVERRLSLDSEAERLALLGDAAPAAEGLDLLDLGPLPATWPEVGGRLLGLGGVRAFVREEPLRPVGAVAHRARLLLDERHDGVPPSTPTTAGTVRSVRLVRQAVRHDPVRREAWPVPGDVQVEHLHAMEGFPASRAGREPAGWLVELLVPDVPPQP